MHQFLTKGGSSLIALFLIAILEPSLRADELKSAEALRAVGAKVVVNPKTQLIHRVSIKGVILSDGALAALSGLKSLESLSLTGQGVTEVHMDAVSKIASLQSVDLAEATINDKDLAKLSKLPKLKALYLYGTKVSEDGLTALATFPNLTTVGLRGDQFTDKALVHLAAIKKLESLYINNTSATQNGIKTLQSQLPKCKISSRR